MRRISSGTPIVWGGRHPTACPEQTVRDHRADIVVRGEGEITFQELVRTLEDSRSLEGVKGITYRTDSDVIHNPDRDPMDAENLVSTPWHLIDVERKLRNEFDRSLSFETGRGCPHACTFCSHDKIKPERYQPFSARYILENIQPLVRKHRIQHVNFYEPHFLSNRARTQELCEEMLKHGLNFTWNASARADVFARLDGEYLSLIKRSGGTHFTFGFESGSEAVLERIQKRIHVDQILKSAYLCKEHGIFMECCFILGFPSETVSDVLETLKLVARLRRIQPHMVIHLQVYTAFPGTVLYNECIREHGLKRVESLEKWGRTSLWQNERPWLRPVRHLALRLLNGSIYASSLDYLLKKRTDLKLRRTLHLLTSLFYGALGLLAGKPRGTSRTPKGKR